MYKGMFTEDELSYLRSLDVVERAEPLKITYTKQFKEDFMRRYNAGEKPKAIFESVGRGCGQKVGPNEVQRGCSHGKLYTGAKG